MKRLITIVLILALLLPCLALADPAEPTERYSTYGATEDVGWIFDGDYFSIDLFISYDLNVYMTVQTWKGHEVSITFKQGTIKSKVDDPVNLYFVFSDGTIYTAHFDDENHVYIWVNIYGQAIRMQYSQWLVPVTDSRLEEIP